MKMWLFVLWVLLSFGEMASAHPILQATSTKSRAEVDQRFNQKPLNVVPNNAASIAIYPATLAERRSAYSKIADELIKSSSDDLRLQLYALAAANRKDKALALLPKLLGSVGTFEDRAWVISCLAELDDPVPAINAVREWLDIDVPAEKFKEFIEPLNGEAAAIEAVIQQLGLLGYAPLAVELMKEINFRIAEFDRLAKKHAPTNKVITNSLNRAKLTEARVSALARNWLISNRSRNLKQPPNLVGLRPARGNYLFQQELPEVVSTLERDYPAPPSRFRDADSFFDKTRAEKIAKRQSAFRQIADRATESGSNNYLLLVKLYGAAQQSDLAVRAADQLILSNKGVDAFGYAIAGLAELDDPKPALKFKDLWLSLEFAPEERSQYAAVVRRGIVPLVSKLAELEKFEEASAVLEQTDKRIKELEPDLKVTESTTRGIRGDLATALSAVRDKRQDLNNVMTLRKSFPSQKLQSINIAFSKTKSRDQNDPAYRSALANRESDLNELASWIKDNPPIDHLVLSRIYAQLNRFEEALAESQAALNEDPTNWSARSRIVEQLLAVGRIDEALKLCRESLARQVPAEANDFFQYTSEMVSSLASALLKAERSEDAAKLATDLMSNSAQFRIAIVGLPKDNQPVVDFNNVTRQLKSAIQPFARTEIKIAVPKMGPEPTAADIIAQAKGNLIAAVNLITEPSVSVKQQNESDPAYRDTLARRRKAIQDVIALLPKPPSNVELAEAYAAADLREETVSAGEKALVENGDSFDAWPQLFHAYSKLSRHEPALALVERWLKAPVTDKNIASHLKCITAPEGLVSALQFLTMKLTLDSTYELGERLRTHLKQVVAEAKKRNPLPPGVTTDLMALVEQKSAFLDSWRPDPKEAALRSQTPMAFTEPLNVTEEWKRLRERFVYQIHQTNLSAKAVETTQRDLDRLFAQARKLAGAEKPIKEIHSEWQSLRKFETIRTLDPIPFMEPLDLNYEFRLLQERFQYQMRVDGLADKAFAVYQRDMERLRIAARKASAPDDFSKRITLALDQAAGTERVRQVESRVSSDYAAIAKIRKAIESAKPSASAVPGQATQPPTNTVEFRRKALQEYLAGLKAPLPPQVMIVALGYQDLKSDATLSAEKALANSNGSFENWPPVIEGLGLLSDPGPVTAYLQRWIDAQVKDDELLNYLRCIRWGSGFSRVLDNWANAGRFDLCRLWAPKVSERAATVLNHARTATKRLPEWNDDSLLRIELGLKHFNDWKRLEQQAMNSSSEPLVFSEPLDVHVEMERIQQRRDYQNALGSSGKAEQITTAQANLKAGASETYRRDMKRLGQLAEKTNASTLEGLSEIYALAQSPTDFDRIATKLQQQDVDDFVKMMVLSNRYKSVGLPEKADALLDRAFAITPSPDKSGDYVYKALDAGTAIVFAHLAQRDIAAAQKIKNKLNRIANLPRPGNWPKGAHTPDETLKLLEFAIERIQTQLNLIGQTCPPIGVKGTTQGESFELDKMHGKVIVLVFWNYDSKDWHVKEETKLLETYAPEKLAFRHVVTANYKISFAANNMQFTKTDNLNVDDAIKQTIELLSRYKLTKEVSVTTGNEVSRRFGASNHTTVVVGRSGKVIEILDDWDKEIEAKLKEAIAKAEQ